MPLQPRSLLRGVPPAALVGPEHLMREAGLTSVLRLGSNESHFGPGPKARAALEGALPGVSHYGDPSNHDLREALAARHGVGVHEICVSAGIDDLLAMVARAYIEPGTPAIAMEGTFPTFEMNVCSCGAAMHRVPYEVPRVEIEDLLDAARPARGGLVYLANPDNPTGTVCTVPEVETLIEGLPSSSLLVLDEAYANFLPAADRLPDDVIDPRVIRLRTFSKEYGLAGLRVGYAIAAEPVIRAMEGVRNLYGVSSLAQAAALASLDDDSYVSAVLRRIAAIRVEYEALGRRLNVPVVRSATNFVLFDCGGRARAEAVVAGLLRRGIHIRKPQAPALAGFVRISIGREEHVEPLSTALAQVLSGGSA